MIFATPPFGLATLASDRWKKLALCALLALGLKSVGQAVMIPAETGSGIAASAAVIETDEAEPGLASWIEPVRDWVEEEYDVPAATIEPALIAAEALGRPLGIDPLLIVAVIATESSFQHRAVSKMGAKGLMQIIPRYHKDKIGQQGDRALFDPEFNVRIGTLVLHEALNRYGSLSKALQYYNGALHDENRSYTRKVLAFRKRLRDIAGTPGAGSLG